MDFASPFVEDERVSVLMRNFEDVIYKEEKLLTKLKKTETDSQRSKYTSHLKKVQKNKKYILKQINNLKNVI